MPTTESLQQKEKGKRIATDTALMMKNQLGKKSSKDLSLFLYSEFHSLS